MLFTWANLIILGVVLVVLLIYRQLDRDNRSLEKVKKYAERLQGDLSAYVDKRAEDLQRYAIELDVQQKAAKEVLKRIQGVEEGLGARAEAIGAIEKRLTEYDSALSRLMQMTQAVDENLSRLHEESEFTDSVNRKLDAAQKSFEAIQRELPALREGFVRDNQADLATFKDGLLAEVGRRLNETTAILDKAGAEAIALQKQAENARHETEREFALAFQRARSEAEKLEDAAFEKLRENSEAKAARLKETVEEKFREIGQAAKEKAAETQGLLKGLKADWKAESEGLLDATKAEIGAAAESLGQRLDAAEARLTEFEGNYAEKAERVERKAEELAAALQEKIKAALSAHKEELERRAAETKASAEKAASGLAELQAAAAAGFERRLAEFGSDVEGKFARLESVNVDIGALEAALRESMAQAERRVENDFAAFEQAFEARNARFEETFQAESLTLRDAMKSLESELDVLKSRAYENVSEKLKVFEDEFFADLKARSEGIDARLASWKEEVDASLGELATKSEAERAAAERAALEELRLHMADTQARTLDQLEKLRGRVQGIADGIAAQGGMATEALEALKASVKQDSADAQKTARAYVEAELARLNLESDNRLKAAERSLDEGLAKLAAGVSAETERLRSLREGTEAATLAFKSEFSKGLSEADKALRADLEAFRQTSRSLSDSLRKDYEAQRDGFMKQSQAERDRLTKELEGLADRTAELRQDLSSRIASALEGFSRGYEAFAADLAKRQKEAESEVEAKLRSLRDVASDLGLKVETTRAQAFAKVEGEASRISASLAEIEKEQKAFVAQTKLFERTDELKASLAAAMDSMKADLAKLDARKAEVAEIENQLNRVKRLEDEVNQKVARFLAEKRRIDALEADFGRLSEVSQGVDRKLEEVTGQSDALTEAQTRIRKILELSAEAEAKFDRLEKKSQVLDATAEAVDKNFQQTQGIEKIIQACGVELKRLPDRINEIKRSVDELAAGKEKADEAVRRLGELDGILADAEKRIAEAQKAREWLARAETRLEEVNRQATEQLKLLSTLLKEEGGGSRAAGSRGAPPSTVQETVRKLARQGWTTDEIARAVKVSRGEVELILELSGKD
jgi:chromosome segregation ATPase